MHIKHYCIFVPQCVKVVSIKSLFLCGLDFVPRRLGFHATCWTH